MIFNSTLISGTIQTRYKRFFADIILNNGEKVVAHVANTGSMKTCWEPGWKALMTQNDDPKRKLKYTLEMTGNDKTWIGINTQNPNRLAEEWLQQGLIPELKKYKNIKREVTVGESKFDFCLDEQYYLEIKNVTLNLGNGVAGFPDAVTERGQKHLRHLTDLKKMGKGAGMLYIVQREDVEIFTPAANIDPEYNKLLIKANDMGVDIFVVQCRLSPKEITFKQRLPYRLV
jgi:sugar fermentation stimulation protein A